MSKLDHLRQQPLNPADELREILNTLEEHQLQLNSFSAGQARSFLLNLDWLDTLFHELGTAGLDLLPEQVRFQSLQTRLQKKIPLLLRSLGGAAAFSTFRPTPPPPTEKWWWYLDQLAAAQRQRWLRQLTLIFVVVILFASTLIVLYRTVLAPSPEVVARLEAQNSAFEALDKGQVQTALAMVEQGLVKVPGDPELLLFQGVLQEILGENVAAVAAFEQSRVHFKDPLAFYLTRSQLQLRVGQPARAEADARTALTHNQNSAKGWFLLGQILEIQDKLAEAVPAYQKASELAVNSDEGEIMVMARLALGRLSATQ